MKVLSIIVFGCTSQRPNTLSQHLDLSEFGVLKKGTIKEFLFFASREVLSRTKPGQGQSVSHQVNENDPSSKFIVHAFINNKQMGATVISDSAYPARAAHNLILKSIEEVCSVHGSDVNNKYSNDVTLNTPNLARLMNEYQQPTQVDQILRINKDIEETKDIMEKNIHQLLSTHEDLDSLMAKSQDLSFKSRELAKTAKKMNRCGGGCSIM